VIPEDLYQENNPHNDPIIPGSSVYLKSQFKILQGNEEKVIVKVTMCPVYHVVLNLPKQIIKIK